MAGEFFNILREADMTQQAGDGKLEVKAIADPDGRIMSGAWAVLQSEGRVVYGEWPITKIEITPTQVVIHRENVLPAVKGHSMFFGFGW